MSIEFLPASFECCVESFQVSSAAVVVVPDARTQHPQLCILRQAVVRVSLEHADEMFPVSVHIVHDAMTVQEVLKVAEEKLECAIEDLRFDSKYLGKGQTVQEAGLEDGAEIAAVVP